MHHEGESHDLGHIVPFKTYANILGILLVLTIVTVAISYVDFGMMNIIVAMIIASIKAGLVGLYFMHLKYEKPYIWLFVLFPFILLLTMIGGIFIDNPLR